MEIQTKIIEILEHNGIVVSQENSTYKINNSELSSIAFVSALVEIEKEFSIIFPDYLLNYSLFEDFTKFIEIIRNMIDDEKNI